MRNFYWHKLCQAVVTLVLLWRILMLVQLCGNFAAPKCFVKFAAPIGHCNNFTIFGMDGSPTAQLSVDNMTNWLQQNDTPTGTSCFPITISINSAIKNAFNCAPTNQLQTSADMMARVLFVCLLFLLILVFHIFVQQPSAEEYDLIGYMCAWFGVILWCCSGVIALVLALNWTARWECTNFRPDDQSLILLIILAFSVVLMCSSLHEIFYNRSLLRDDDKGAPNPSSADDNDDDEKKKQIAAEDKMPTKISAVKGFKKNDELFSISVISRGNTF